jgi:hypothetical protein
MGLFSKKGAADNALQSNEKLLNDFLNKSEGLQRILEKETEYFRDMKMKQAEVLIETKLNLIDELEVIKNTLTSNPAILKSIPESEKNKIKKANKSLMDAAEDNYNETLKAKEVNKLILEAISEAVNDSKRIDGAYGDKGNAYKSDGLSSAVAVVHNA